MRHPVPGSRQTKPHASARSSACRQPSRTSVADLLRQVAAGVNLSDADRPRGSNAPPARTIGHEGRGARPAPPVSGPLAAGHVGAGQRLDGADIVAQGALRSGVGSREGRQHGRSPAPSPGSAPATPVCDGCGSRIHPGRRVELRVGCCGIPGGPQPGREYASSRWWRSTPWTRPRRSRGVAAAGPGRGESSQSQRRRRAVRRRRARPEPDAGRRPGAEPGAAGSSPPRCGR